MRLRLPSLLGLFLLLTVFTMPALAQRVPEPVPPWRESLKLTEISTTGDGALTVYHPDGWSTLADFNQLTFASSNRLLNEQYPFNLRREGDFRAGVFVLDEDLSGEDEVEMLDILMASFLDVATEDQRLGFDFNTPQSIDVNGRSALIVIGTSQDSDQVFVAVSLGNGYYAAVLFFATAGSGTNFIDIAEAIAGEMEYFPEADEDSPQDRQNTA